MERLILEDFRCFAGRHEAPLAPLTVLAGENSSGKSSFLAAIRLAWDAAYRREPADFNEEPFLLGAYDQIATYRRGRPGRAQSFKIGVVVRARFRGRRSACISVESGFGRSGSQPLVTSRTLAVDEYAISLSSLNERAPRLVVSWPGGNSELVDAPQNSDSIIPTLPFSLMAWSDMFLFLEGSARSRSPKLVSRKIPSAVIEQLSLSTRELRANLGVRPYALAPVRATPKRTYDPIRALPDPEGEHIPMVLSRLLANPRQAPELSKRLQEFGKQSGLFEDVEVRRLRREEDPFQILVKLGSQTRNLIDVGYGVSQILPILVEVLTGPEGRTYLIQQPEVHLHPRAQAALATLLGTLVKEGRCRLVIETHSDYFIDRLRLDIRDGKTLTPKDVSLLYFERNATGVTIHPIGLDDQGNLVDAPPTYRQFFLEEERRFFLGV